MRRPIRLLFPLLLTFAAASGQTPDSNEAKLREALRNATLQLRSAESERAGLQASQATLAEEKKVLTERLEALRKQAATERAADAAVLASLRARQSALEAEGAKLKAALEKAEAVGKQAAELAAAKETERARQAAELVVLQRRIEDREGKNLALFTVGNEILTRYEKFSLGEALAAREPFVGRTRARLENLVQDYQDKLLAQRAKP